MATGEPTYEWATRYPSGHVCPWAGEDQARRANELSKVYPGGEHALVRRTVGEWELV